MRKQGRQIDAFKSNLNMIYVCNQRIQAMLENPEPEVAAYTDRVYEYFQNIDSYLDLLKDALKE